MGVKHEHELRLLCPPGFSFSGEFLSSCTVAGSWLSVTDSWYVPAAVADWEAHEDWVAGGGAAPVRIRQLSRDGHRSCQLEVKQLGAPGDFSAAEETALDCDDPRAAHEFLRAAGFVHVVDIAKTRSVYEHADQIGISLDDYGDARILELEIQSTTGVPEPALDSLRRWATRHFGGGLRELDEPYVLRVVRSALRPPESPT